MLHIRDHQLSIMVLYCIVLHLLWASLIVIDDAALGATAVDALYRVVGHKWLVPPILFTASVMAITALMMRLPWIVLFLLPQQFILMLSAGGAFTAIWIAQFADGVVRPQAFIAADQIHIILAAIGHTTAIIVHARAQA